MKLKSMIIFITFLMLLTQSCSGNRDAELAFKAASAEMSEANILLYADDAYHELSNLNIEDACKLTLAYYYLYREHYTKEYGNRFGACYEYAINKGEGVANDYFKALTGVDNVGAMLKNAHDTIELMEQASDALNEMKERDIKINDELNSLPSDEIRMGAMAFFEQTRRQRHYIMPETYLTLKDFQKQLLSPLGLVVCDYNLKLIVNNEDLNSSTWYYAQEKASSCHAEDIKNWRLMTLSEGRLLSGIYDDLLYWAERWKEVGIACDMAIINAYTSTTNGNNCYTIDISNGMEYLYPKDEDWMGFGRYVSSI